MEKILVHLGCGKRDFGPGWINIDIADYPHIHYKDITKLPFQDNSCDLLYASHLINYFDYNLELPNILKEWRRVLKPRGTLRIAVPDMCIIMGLLRDNRFPLSAFLGPIYGRMQINDNYIYHKHGYDFQHLEKTLMSLGFHNIHRYNWRKTDHGCFDDHSQAYLPHMDKENGILISLNVECTKNPILKFNHGMHGTPTYSSWSSMIQRCSNSNSTSYKSYGGRNIIIEDKRWFEFGNFFNDMGERPRWGSLGRINNNTGYCQANCRWETILEQSNNKRNSHFLAYKGITKPVPVWAREYGVPPHIVLSRVNLGWDAEESLETPYTKREPIEINGEFKLLSEWAKIYKVNFKTVSARIKNGWDIIDALSINVNKTKLIKFGNREQTLMEWSRELNIDRSVLYDRLYRNDWSVERAFLEPVKNKNI